MPRWIILRICLITLTLWAVPGCRNQAARYRPDTSPTALRGPETLPLTNADIIQMSQARVGDAIIIKKVTSTPQRFDLSPRAIVELKEHGVSEPVIQAMLERQSVASGEPYRPRSSPRPDDSPAVIVEHYPVHGYGWEHHHHHYHERSTTSTGEPVSSSSEFRTAPSLGPALSPIDRPALGSDFASPADFNPGDFAAPATGGRLPLGKPSLPGL